MRQMRGDKDSQNGKLLYVQDLFASFSRWKDAGFVSRMIQMFYRYSPDFDKIYIVTYDDKNFSSYFPENVEHICVSHNIPMPYKRLFYFFTAGLVIRNDVKYVEISGTTAIIPALAYKIIGKRIFLYHKWDLAKTLKEHNKLFLSLLAKIIKIFALKISDTIAVTTKTLGEDVKRYTNPRKVYLLPNFVDADLFEPYPGCEKQKNLLVFIGRLHEDKNLFMLLEILKELPQYKLWIIGDGPLKGDLTDIINKNKLKNVKILEVLPHEELPKYLNRAEAFIIVSHSEGHPKALIEAMACGLPCIGSNVDGIKDVIIDGETGVLCERNVEDIKRGILDLFEDRANMKEIGRNARKFVVENYSREEILERRIKLIKGELDGIEPLFSEVIEHGRR